jgi:hypothetical protein
MPNWCQNETEVLGSVEDITEILRLAQTTQYELDEVDGELKVYETPFSMNGLVPMPSHLLNTKATVGKEKEGEFANAIAGNRDYEYSDWYGWRLAHWGTKWDLNPETTQLNEMVVNDDNASFSISYDTAWSPVNDFWIKVSEMFPNVRIDNRFFEEGCNFIGQTIIEGGETLADECGEITAEDYTKAGAVLDNEGNINWDESDDYDLWSLFPLVEL